MTNEEKIIAAVAGIIPDQSFAVITEDGMVTFGWEPSEVPRLLSLALLGACGDDLRAAIMAFGAATVEYERGGDLRAAILAFAKATAEYELFKQQQPKDDDA